MKIRTLHPSLTLGSLAMLVTVMAGPVQEAAAGDRTRAHVVTRTTPVASAEPSQNVTYVSIHSHQHSHAQLVVRRVVDPASTVSRELSQQPVMPHLAEVRLTGTTIHVDPNVDYRRPTGGLDENHTIRRAQRLHQLAEPTAPARVVRSPLAAEQDEAQPKQAPMPRAIFLRPDAMQPTPSPDPTAPSLPDVQDQDESPSTPIPHVPAPPREKSQRMVMNH